MSEHRTPNPNQKNTSSNPIAKLNELLKDHEAPKATEASFQGLYDSVTKIIQGSPNRGRIKLLGKTVKGIDDSGFFRHRGETEETRAVSFYVDPKSRLMGHQIVGPSVGIHIKAGGIEQPMGPQTADAYSVSLTVANDGGNIRVICESRDQQGVSQPGRSIYGASQELMDWVDGQVGDPTELIPITTPESMQYQSKMGRLLGKIGLNS